MSFERIFERDVYHDEQYERRTGLVTQSLLSSTNKTLTS
jgi:hypothetical protein